MAINTHRYMALAADVGMWYHDNLPPTSPRLFSNRDDTHEGELCATDV
jgi:hypothetical protein